MEVGSPEDIVQARKFIFCGDFSNFKIHGCHGWGFYGGRKRRGILFAIKYIYSVSISSFHRLNFHHRPQIIFPCPSKIIHHCKDYCSSKDGDAIIHLGGRWVVFRRPEPKYHHNTCEGQCKDVIQRSPNPFHPEWTPGEALIGVLAWLKNIPSNSSIQEQREGNDI